MAIGKKIDDLRKFRVFDCRDKLKLFDPRMARLKVFGACVLRKMNDRR